MPEIAPRVQFFHWNALNATDKEILLRATGLQVTCLPFEGPLTLKALRVDPPAAVVIDLSRQPSSGRDLALQLRTHSATRHLPILFVDGAPEKTQPLAALFPDAIYTNWDAIIETLKDAVQNPPPVTCIPDSIFAPYKDVPLVRKLGIREGMRVRLVDAPPDFERKLGELPPEVSLVRNGSQPAALNLAFIRSREDLERKITSLVNLVKQGKLWIIWPKRKSKDAGAINQNHVRRAGLAAGMVDFKICSVDETWTGLQFTWRGT